MTKIVKEDLAYIHNKLNKKEKKKFRNSTVLITGCAGFLGYYFMQYLSKYSNELGIKKIIGLDNFMLSNPEWIEKLQEKNKKVTIHTFNVITDELKDIKGAKEANLIIHMASIASPIFYRKYPIETIDANIWGLRSLLDFYKDRDIKGLLFFSSSEIYGDPDVENIPTSEEYRGLVSCTGPRACYDESKRFGETMCSLFAKEHNMPIGVARPFNNYGPGVSIKDKRVVADFANSAYNGKDIVMFSDGSPTRTFCYISDAITGYLKILMYGKYDYFNIGINRPEITMKELSKIYQKAAKKIFNNDIKVKFEKSSDKDYLTDNPNRRSPIIKKAAKKLDYKPEILVEEGVERFLKFLKESGAKL